MRQDDLYSIPAGLPVPADDGACNHLPGQRLPPIELRSTRGRQVRLDLVPAQWTVVYCYPRTGVPDRDSPPGWDAIPGARGCTPQNCSFRDHYAQLQALGAEVFGLSTQTTDYQQEMAERLHLPYEVLSDADLELTNVLRLPTFTYGDWTLLRRMTLVLREATIVKVFYPVFPPNADAGWVETWLAERARSAPAPPG